STMGTRSARGGCSSFAGLEPAVHGARHEPAPGRERPRLAWSLAPVAIAVLAAASACGSRNEPAPAEEAPVASRPSAAGLADHTDRLMRLPGVVGVYEGRDGGSPIVVVLVVDSTHAGQIPQQLDGYAVHIEISGPIRPMHDR